MQITFGRCQQNLSSMTSGREMHGSGWHGPPPGPSDLAYIHFLCATSSSPQLLLLLQFRRQQGSLPLEAFQKKASSVPEKVPFLSKR